MLQLGGGSCYGHLVGCYWYLARDAAKHPTSTGQRHNKGLSGPNVNSADTEKPEEGKSGEETGQKRGSGQSDLTSVSQAQGSAGSCGVDYRSSVCLDVSKLRSRCQDPLAQRSKHLGESRSKEEAPFRWQVAQV